MGYACPVCDAPQADGEHLANHLAFTALLHGGDHGAWLAEHVPDWEASGPDELGERVAELAEEVDVGGTSADGSAPEGVDPGAVPEAALDEDARRVLREARELTERMRPEE